MKQISHIKILLLCLLLILTTHSNIRSLNLFLTKDETWLFFPHRYPLKTYTAQCQLINNNHTSQHPQLQTIAYFEFNNTCTSIDILSDPTQKQPIFYFAKLLPEECTIYQVREEKISVYFKYTNIYDFKNVLMLNQFNTLLWNDTKMMRIQYSLVNNQVNSYELPLDSQPIRACSKNNNYSAFCWNDKQFIVYNFQNQEIEVSVTNFASQSQYMIKTILPLQPEQRIYFVCQSIICNVSKITKDKITTIMTYNFVPRILGGAIYPQKNSIMIVNQQNINIYTYVLFSQIQMKYEQSIPFPQEFECINYDHSVFTKDLIIVECFNFLGQQQKLVLVRDAQTNSYIPYNPFVNKITQDCWLGGNSLHLFTLCTDQITIKNTNFYYLQLNSNFPSTSSKQPSFNLSLQCTNFDGTQCKQQQIFKIQIKKSQIGQAYANQPIAAENQMSYSEVKSLKLTNYFKASNIVAYQLESDCKFIQKLQYQPIQYLSYFSLYNRQNCVQIISGGADLFYRLIEINNTVFYLEQCHLNKIGYGCQLSQIYQGSQSLRLGIYDFTLIKIFIVEGNLEANYQNKTKIIFEHKVEQLQIQDNIIRIKTRTTYYTNTVQNVINNCGEWISQQRTNRYFYSGSISLQLNQDGLIKQYENGVLISQTLFLQLAYNYSPQTQNQQNDTAIKLPYIAKKAYYFLIIGQDYITKFYHRQKVIHIYSLPYNPQNYTITDIKLTDDYLTIQYQSGIFQIYDIQQQTVSAKLITIFESIMTDVIVLAQDVLLIPIQSQTTLIKIQRNPILTFGNFAPSYSRFQETCKFKLKVSVQNGSCPLILHNSPQESSIVSEQNEQIFQQFKVKIKYNVQQINLGMTVETQIEPTECQNCWIDLNQFQYQGPIFAYQLNDDYFQHFILIPHLEIATCNEKQSILLKNLSKIRFEGDSSSNQVVMSDGSFIYLMDTQLSIINQYKLQDTHYCLSYVKLQQDYLILCNKYLLVLHQNQTLISFDHNLTIRSSSRHDPQLQFQKLQNQTFLIYILDRNTTIYIYEYDYNQETIKHINNYVFRCGIEDLKVVDSRIIILKINTICLAQTKNQTNMHFLHDLDSANQNCYDLVNIIPTRYTGNHWFEEIIPYYSNESLIKALLISKNVSNLHIDLTIEMDQYPIAFIITNVYAGYPGFQFSDFISINLTNDSYSNFIMLYQDEVKKNSSLLLAYYPYNYGFEGDRIIGQIKTAHFLENYFSKPYNFTFLAFEDSMFIMHHSVQLKSHSEIVNTSSQKQSKECLYISVHTMLQIKINYNQTPPIKFLILRANNLISIDSHFIRLHFTEQNQSLEISLIGLAITLVLFIILVMATNRCKSSESDIEVHFMREQDEIDHPSYQPSLTNQQSSLLHSKTLSQVASEQYQKGQCEDQKEDEIVIIRQE